MGIITTLGGKGLTGLISAVVILGIIKSTDD
jgi:hypothetical protein